MKTVGEKFSVFMIGSIMTGGSASAFSLINLVILLTFLKSLAGLL